MSGDGVIAKLNTALHALAEAKTLQDVKRISDLAHAAEIYAKQQKLGEDAIGYAHSIKIEALRRLGEMLRETPKNTGTAGLGRPSLGGAKPEPPKDIPTLAESGIDKKTSAISQKLAAMPEPEFEKVKHGVLSVSRATKMIRAEQEKKDLEEAQKSVSKEKIRSVESVCDLRVCSCADLFRSGIKPDAVITDPPYPAEFLPVFSELAEGCKIANVPVVGVMVGQLYLPEVINRLCEHLKYRWTIAYLLPGGQSARVWPVKVNPFWKPVLLFGESTDWFGDVASSDTNDNDKRFHGWGQSESGMADLVERLTKPNQLVCDPFLGGGTTAVVSLALGRRFVGCDIDAEHVEMTRKRVMVCTE